MVLLRCTSKLLKVLGIRPASLQDREPDGSWEEWYANLLWIERRKCLLITHGRTLFSVFVPDVVKTDITPLGPFLSRQIWFSLITEGLPSTTFGALDPEGLEFARTADRRILGCMADQAFGCEYEVLGSGGLRHSNMVEINRRLHRSIHSLTSGRYPIDLVLEHLKRVPHNNPVQPTPPAGA
jgi:Domain of unknown function (DUF6933)